MSQSPTPVDALTYPNALVVDRIESGGVYNLLLTTRDDLGKVWKWYARRLRAGKSPITAGIRDYVVGRMRMATRRSNRLPNRNAPFTDAEEPQVITIHQGERGITVALSHLEDGGTAITLFIFE